jgi:predicted nuclease with TOPRIM domain
MTDPINAEMAAARLAEITHEVEELEKSRAALLKRVDRLRAELQATATRTASMRASASLLFEHLSNLVLAMAELRALEEEVYSVGQGLAGAAQESSGFKFEADSFNETLEEAEDDLERLSSILLDGKARRTRGH